MDNIITGNSLTFKKDHIIVSLDQEFKKNDVFKAIWQSSPNSNDIFIMGIGNLKKSLFKEFDKNLS